MRLKLLIECQAVQTSSHKSDMYFSMGTMLFLLAICAFNRFEAYLL